MISVIMLLVGGSIIIIMELDLYIGQLILLLLLTVPGIFYFLNNSVEIKEALIISALFGFSLMPAIFFVIIIPLSFFTGFFLGEIPDYGAIFSMVDFTQLLMDLAFMGFMIFIPVFLSYFIAAFFRNRRAN